MHRHKLILVLTGLAALVLLLVFIYSPTETDFYHLHFSHGHHHFESNPDYSHVVKQEPGKPETVRPHSYQKPPSPKPKPKYIAPSPVAKPKKAAPSPSSQPKRVTNPNARRSSDVHELCSLISKAKDMTFAEPTVILTFVSGDGIYQQMFENLLESMRRNTKDHHVQGTGKKSTGAESHVVALALDEEAFETLSGQKDVYVFFNDSITLSDEGNVHSTRSKRFKSVVAMKTFYTLLALRECRSSVLVVDLDMVWQRDAWNFLRTIVGLYNDMTRYRSSLGKMADIISQVEVTSILSEEPSSSELHTLNSGFMWLKQSPRMWSFMQDVVQAEAANPKKMTNQRAINDVLWNNADYKDNLHVLRLPYDLFPNGFVYFQWGQKTANPIYGGETTKSSADEQGEKKSTTHYDSGTLEVLVAANQEAFGETDEPIIVHANFEHGPEVKVYRFLESDMWFLPTPDVTEYGSSVSAQKSASRKYITFRVLSNVPVTEMYRRLLFSLQVGRALGRTVILPRLYFTSQNVGETSDAANGKCAGNCATIDSLFEYMQLFRDHDCVPHAALKKFDGHIEEVNAREVLEVLSERTAGGDISFREVIRALSRFTGTVIDVSVISEVYDHPEIYQYHLAPKSACVKEITYYRKEKPVTCVYGSEASMSEVNSTGYTFFFPSQEKGMSEWKLTKENSLHKKKARVLGNIFNSKPLISPFNTNLPILLATEVCARADAFRFVGEEDSFVKVVQGIRNGGGSYNPCNAWKVEMGTIPERLAHNVTAIDWRSA